MGIHRPIYLDYNATTPTDPRVIEVMLPYFFEKFGNPSSQSHAFGWEAQDAVEEARKSVANLVNSLPKEIVWTSGATESNNIALLGSMDCSKGPHHVITSAIEHKCILESSRFLEKKGMEVTYLPVSKEGQVRPEDVKKALRPHTRLISIMMANNEIGTINPIREIGIIAEEAGVLFHTDAAQALGKMKIDVVDLKVDLMSLSGHKNYGPKGVGALVVRKIKPSLELNPLFGGGSQEFGLRPGTLNVPGIVGMGESCRISQESLVSETHRVQAFRDQILSAVSDFPEIFVNGHKTDRLCNNVSLSFRGLSSDLFALGLNGLAVSSTSACSSQSGSVSHVLRSIGHDDNLARATVRIGLGRFTTENDIQFAIEKIKKLLEKNKKNLTRAEF